VVVKHLPIGLMDIVLTTFFIIAAKVQISEQNTKYNLGFVIKSALQVLKLQGVV
jgi:hypothetical protein